MSKCIPRNQLNQAETQNSNERQIVVGASKPNLVDVFFERERERERERVEIDQYDSCPGEDNYRCDVM